MKALLQQQQERCASPQQSFDFGTTHEAANDRAAHVVHRYNNRYTVPMYQTPEWRATRKLALDRAGWKCERCLKRLPKAVRLDCHHIEPVSQYPELFFVLSNIIVLCFDCHDVETMKQAVRYGWRYSLKA